MFSKRFLIAASALAFALPIAARAQSESKLDEQWEKLAGSDANAKSLVEGLRNGTQVTLTNGTSTTTFTPPTGKMGKGSIDNALLLARESLKEQGVRKPTPDQLKTAVMNVLDQRAQHIGWGEIAKSMNVKLGELKHEERERLARADRREDRAERHERPEKPEKPERPDRSERGR